MAPLRLAACLALALLTVGSCQLGNAQLATKRELADAKTEIQKLRDELERVSGQLGRLDFRVRIEAQAVAYLTPGDTGYSMIRGNLGLLTVQLSNVQPYANGSRVALQFGNLASATINDTSATLEWGSLTASGEPDTEHQKSREVKFNESLKAGAWTTVSVVLDSVPPERLGFVRVRDLHHSGIALRQ